MKFFLLLYIAIAWVPYAFAQEQLTFGLKLQPALQPAIELFKNFGPDCTDEFYSIEEALLYPRAACELFIQTPGTLIVADSIKRLIHVTSFAIDGPSNVVIPKELWQLTALNELQIANTDLANIPSEIGNLTHLLVLDLQGNQLKELPETIKNITTLNVLNVKNNLLTAQAKEQLQQWLPQVTIIFE